MSNPVRSPQSLGTPQGPRVHHICNYCSQPAEGMGPPTNAFIASFDAQVLTPEVYQNMIDRGWRRSGKWCYKPDLLRSCCPHYTIKLDANQFKLSKGQRKTLNRWNRFITDGDGKDDVPRKIASPKNSNVTPSLESLVHASEVAFHPDQTFRHRYEVILEPSTYTEEKFALFDKYQKEIHHEEFNSPTSFSRFLVKSPIEQEPIPFETVPPSSHLPTAYGSYHQLHRVDGRLIGVSVLDVLPGCVSSVYFFYDKDWERFSMGKLSAFHETVLARELKAAGAPGMSALYMGFYIHSCPKMRYKADYSPSFLADPVTWEWYPLEECQPLLDKSRFACFSDTSKSSNLPAAEDAQAERPVPNFRKSDVNEVTIRHYQYGRNRERGRPFDIPLAISPYWDYDEIRAIFSHCIDALSLDVAKKIIFVL